MKHFFLFFCIFHLQLEAMEQLCHSILSPNNIRNEDRDESFYANLATIAAFQILQEQANAALPAFKTSINFKSSNEQSKPEVLSNIQTPPENDASINSTKKIFCCSQCQKSFRSRSSLQRHEKVHNGPPRYQCPLCPKVFYRADYLKDHKVIHTNERKYKCMQNGCGKAYKNRAGLFKHKCLAQ